MRSSSPDRRREIRVLAAVVLALFALGWLADRAHSAFERHAWCDEHQRVEHAASSSDVCNHDGSLAASDDRHDPSFEALDADPAEHATCCVLLARGDDPVALPAAELTWPALLVAAAFGRAPPLNAERHAPISLVLLAPKQSPPAI